MEKKQRKFNLNYRNTYKKFTVKNYFYIGKHDVGILLYNLNNRFINIDINFPGQIV